MSIDSREKLHKLDPLSNNRHNCSANAIFMRSIGEIPMPLFMTPVKTDIL